MTSVANGRVVDMTADVEAAAAGRDLGVWAELVGQTAAVATLRRAVSGEPHAMSHANMARERSRRPMSPRVIAVRSSTIRPRRSSSSPRQHQLYRQPSSRESGPSISQQLEMSTGHRERRSAARARSPRAKVDSDAARRRRSARASD